MYGAGTGVTAVTVGAITTANPERRNPVTCASAAAGSAESVTVWSDSPAAANTGFTASATVAPDAFTPVASRLLRNISRMILFGV